ncbi:MAG: hypothetical protein P8O83_00825 [Flavobacteriaceae bacterium]|nr:hypothetical protein [Flavobacteriaceae bacterium]
MPIFNNPYPLLDNEKGNFQYSSFDCELVESKIENGIYFFQFKAELNDDVLTNLIDEGIVSFVVKVESKPYFLNYYRSSKNNYEIEIELDYKDISSGFSFEFTPLLISNVALDYQNENANSPMCDYTFNLNAYQVLGSCSTVKLGFETAYRTIDSGPLIKITRMSAPEKPLAGSMRINLNNDDQIQVKIASDTYDRFIEVNSRDNKLLDSLVALPVLQFTLNELMKDPQLHDKEWAKNLDVEFDIFSVQDQEGILKKCDEILNSPIPSYIKHYLKKYDDNN